MDDERSDKRSFEDFPRAYLYNKISRGQFFEVIKTESRLLARQEIGARIPQLGVMEDHELYDIIPRILLGTRIIPEEEEVWAIPPGHTKRVRLLELEPDVLFVFNKINGYNSLKEIAQSLTDFSGRPFERAFLFTPHSS